MNALDFVSTGFQSQVVRLFCSNFFEGNMLTSDIDMLPINGDYYRQYFNELNDDNVIIYSGQPYSDVPYYPMCYVLSNSLNFRDYLGIDGLKFDEYCKMLHNQYGEKWNTDEHFMYDRFQNFSDKLIVKKERDFSRRVDRGNWDYQVNLLDSGYYIDSHLLRPYKQNRKHIDQLIELI